MRLNPLGERHLANLPRKTSQRVDVATKPSASGRSPAIAPVAGKAAGSGRNPAVMQVANKASGRSAAVGASISNRKLPSVKPKPAPEPEPELEEVVEEAPAEVPLEDESL